MMETLSFSRFVREFDVVTNEYLSSSQEINKFLKILCKGSINNKYEFVFPLFYNFSIVNSKICFLRNSAGESYEWLIRESIKKQVDKHSSYGLGITESYCKSEIGPSYLKIKKSQNGEKKIDVEIVPYDKVNFSDAYLSLSIEKDDDKLEIKPAGKSETLETIDEEWKEWEVGFVMDDNEGIKCINDDTGFVQGIKAHWPIIEDGKRTLYYFFSNNLKVKEADNKQYGFGGLFVISNEELNESELGFFVLAGYTLANKVALSQIQRSVRIESIKSAVAALMSRNMSHNLGSHFLSNSKNHFAKRIKQIKTIGTDEIGKDYRGLVAMLQYIQERMDFIATLVSGDPYPYGSLFFKSQMFDVLTIDDFGKRHEKETYNFLLKYLVLSEKLTRGKNDLPGVHEVLLQVKYKNQLYTGRKEGEESLKTALSQLQFAVPGGLMGRHALFTIFENLIRNSAKHEKKEENLIVTILIEEDIAKRGMLKISIFDNRENEAAKSLIEEKFNHLIILNDDGSINKDNKGLKEMLICALWLRNEDVKEKLFEIQSYEDGNRNDKIKEYLEVGEKEDSLCYSFWINPFENLYSINLKNEINWDLISNIHAEIVVLDDVDSIDDKREKQEKLKRIFPRFVCASKNSCDTIRSLYKESFFKERGIDENSIHILINSDKHNGHVKSNIHGTTETNANVIFSNHFYDASIQKKMEDLKKFENAHYIDSISGGNFTDTIVSPAFIDDEWRNFLVIESALTKITIIDERIYNDYVLRQKQSFAKINNIRVGLNKKRTEIQNEKTEDYVVREKLVDYLKKTYSKTYKELEKSLQDQQSCEDLINFVAPDINMEQILLEKRNVFVLDIRINNGEVALFDLSGQKVDDSFKTDFLSIHLGQIEKLKEPSKVMEKLKQISKFVCIHSGRGNFSPELEKQLKDYPFISLSALEAAFNNSKYLLSQLFYTTNYYGKGNIGNK